MFPIATEEKGRELALNSLTRNSKGNALRVMRRSTDPSQLWQHLKERYEANNNPRKMHLIKKFFSTKKISSMSMDEYLTKMKEVADLLEDAGVPLPEDAVVWYTLKNLPQEYDIVKQMILCDSLPTYNKRKVQLLSEEMSRKVKKNEEKDSEALAVSHNNSRRTYERAPNNRFGHQTYS